MDCFHQSIRIQIHIHTFYHP